MHLDVIGVLGAAVLLYEYGIRRLAEFHAPRGEVVVTRGQRYAFYAGILSLYVVSSWPVHDIGENSLFMFHMSEHLVFGLIAPPLLISGTPWWLIRLVVKPVLPVLRVLTKPLVALALFNGMLGLIHVPGVLNLMLENEFAHFGLHFVLFLTGILMWWPILGPIPDLPQLPPFLDGLCVPAVARADDSGDVPDVRGDAALSDLRDPAAVVGCSCPRRPGLGRAHHEDRRRASVVGLHRVDLVLVVE
jgi:cytochrome c oxidase assembly factor CtaG